MAPFGNFFLPGPTEVTEDVLAAQTRPMIGHRGKGMEELLAKIQPALQRVFRTTRPVYISSSSATGLMEGSLRNGARRRVLSLVNGAFSDRFHKIALACGLEADVLEAEWGGIHEPERVAEALKGGQLRRRHGGALRDLHRRPQSRSPSWPRWPTPRATSSCWWTA